MDIEILKRAQQYIEKLANGIDPLTDETINGNPLLDNARICRCFFFVSDILQQVIDNNGEISKPSKSTRTNKPRFEYNEAVMSILHPSKFPQSLTKSIQFWQSQIDEAYGEDYSEQFGTIPRVAIVDWLVQNEYLETVDRQCGGKTHKLPTPKGQSVGITQSENKVNGIPYIAVNYTPQAQQFILDNLNHILQDNAYSYTPSDTKAKASKPKFVYDSEAIHNLPTNDQPMYLTNLLDSWSNILETQFGRIPNKKVFEWLEEKEYLYTIIDDNGKRRKKATELGLQTGLNNIETSNALGQTYTAVTYNQQAQQFIIDNLHYMIA